MKKPLVKFHKFWVLQARVMAMIILFTGAALAAEKQSVDVNGGFEEGPSNSLTKWAIFGPFQKNLMVSEEKFHGGSRSLRIPINAEIEGKIAGAQQMLDANLFKPGDVVGVSAYVFLTSSACKPGVALEVFGPDGKDIAVASCRIEDLEGEWQLVKSSLTIPENFNQSCTVKLIAKVFSKAAPAGNDDAYIDDIQVSIEQKAK